MGNSKVEKIIKDITDGKLVIIVDDEDRENEGDVVIAAEKITPEAINFMVTHAKGLVCIPMLSERLKILQLPSMVQDNTAPLSTAFTISVDAVKGVSTGISAQDRSNTVKVLIDEDTKPEDLARPGHLFPLRYREGGVLVRAGHTEAAVDLAQMAGLYSAGVICEILSEDGSSAKMDELEDFSKKYNIDIVTIAEIIAYRRSNERMIERVAEARLPTIYGEFTAVSYKSMVDKDEHVALIMGDINKEKPTLVRVHSECLTGDVFDSIRCDCGEQTSASLRMIAEEGTGVFLYMRQEGRGIGIHNKIKAYNLQDQGFDTVDANIHLGFAPDVRYYGIGAQILMDLGIGNMKILTNNPRKIAGLDGFGSLIVTERVPIVIKPNPENVKYLNTKREKMGHLFNDIETK